MSEHTTPPKPSHRSDINSKIVVSVGIVSLVVFAVSVLAAALILKVYTAYLHKTRGEPFPAAFGMKEVGIVDQVHFDADDRLEKWRSARAQHLATYGWVDHGKALIRIPIDKAMDEYLRTANVPPAPPPAAVVPEVAPKPVKAAAPAKAVAPAKPAKAVAPAEAPAPAAPPTPVDNPLEGARL